jgi:NAD-dependent deacetylase
MNLPASLVDHLRRAQAVAVLTGAGVSAESGVPTFRDAQTGLWARYDPLALATPEAFRRDPKLVWEWYAWRRELVARARPNLGHLALRDMEMRLPKFTLITQNVDGLHHLAGSRNVIELHGNIRRARCFDEQAIVESWPESGETPPRCPRCGGLLRPDVVWFGESLPAQALADAVYASQSCDVFFSIGTSALVQPAASLPQRAIARGRVVVEINPDETPLGGEVSADRFYALRGKAGEILPALVQTVWGD